MYVSLIDVSNVSTIDHTQLSYLSAYWNRLSAVFHCVHIMYVSLINATNVWHRWSHKISNLSAYWNINRLSVHYHVCIINRCKQRIHKWSHKISYLSAYWNRLSAGQLKLEVRAEIHEIIRAGLFTALPIIYDETMTFSPRPVWHE